MNSGMEGRLRIESRQKFRQIVESSFTVFIDNPPRSMTKEWLWQIFKLEGKITKKKNDGASGYQSRERGTG